MKGLLSVMFAPMKYQILFVFFLGLLACDDSTMRDGLATGMSGSDGSMQRPVTDIFVVTPDPEPEFDAGMSITPPSSCIDPPAVVPEMVRLETRCRSGNESKRIQDYRNYRCDDFVRFRDEDGDGRSDNTQNIVLDDVLVTGVYGTDFSVQDPDGGAFSGLWIFTDRRELPFPLAVGMRLRLSGQLLEFYTLAELRLDDGDDAMERLPVSGPEPSPILVTDPALIADEGYLVEELESLLVEIPSQFIISTTPDCPRDFDMFVINGGLRIEDEVELTYEPKRGDFVERVVGILHFSFDHQKVMPRNDADLRVTECGGVPDKCEVSDCLFELGALETGTVVITEIQDDPRGGDGPREFVEIFNAGDTAINLSGWRLQNCADLSVELSGVIQPNEYFLVAGSLSGSDNGGLSADQTLAPFQLSNGRGSVLLINAEGELVDQVRYLDESPWPLRQDGESLEVMTLTGDNSNGAVWRSGQGEYGEGGWGSPGRANR